VRRIEKMRIFKTITIAILTTSLLFPLPSSPTTPAPESTISMPGYGCFWDETLPFAGYLEYYESIGAEIDILAKVVWGEARGCTPEEQRLVVWTILQRVDDPRWPNTIKDVVTQRGQFPGYRENSPICEYIWILCYDEVLDWIQGGTPPILEPYAPAAPYYFFDGDGRNNWFREDWEG
jgi:hypothetical protein